MEPFVGKCVALYYRKDPYSGSDDYLLGSDLVYAAEVTIITDEATPSDTLISEDYAKVWGILEAATDIGEPWGLRLRKVENYQKNQMPIEDDGNYTVGKDGDMSPGTWKSGADPTWGSDCYWARINQSTGNIIQNHFGVGGITVRLSEGDIFETNNDCTTWFFINP